MHLIEGYVNHRGPLLQLQPLKFKDPFTNLNSKVSSTMNRTSMHLHKATSTVHHNTRSAQKKK